MDTATAQEEGQARPGQAKDQKNRKLDGNTHGQAKKKAKSWRQCPLVDTTSNSGSPSTEGVESAVELYQMLSAEDVIAHREGLVCRDLVCFVLSCIYGCVGLCGSTDLLAFGTCTWGLTGSEGFRA